MEVCQLINRSVMGFILEGRPRLARIYHIRMGLEKCYRSPQPLYSQMPRDRQPNKLIELAVI